MPGLLKQVENSTSEMALRFASSNRSDAVVDEVGSHRLCV